MKKVVINNFPPTIQKRIIHSSATSISWFLYPYESCSQIVRPSSPSSSQIGSDTLL
jgi:hypothetical protein